MTNTAGENGLKACPFCGRVPAICKTKIMYDQLHGEPYQYFYAKCCIWQTQSRSSIQEAIELANTRATPKAGEVDRQDVYKVILKALKNDGINILVTSHAHNVLLAIEREFILVKRGK